MNLRWHHRLLSLVHIEVRLRMSCCRVFAYALVFACLPVCPSVHPFADGFGTKFIFEDPTIQLELHFVHTFLFATMNSTNIIAILWIIENFMEPEGSMLCSQEPSSGSYPKPEDWGQSVYYPGFCTLVDLNLWLSPAFIIIFPQSPAVWIYPATLWLHDECFIFGFHIARQHFEIHIRNERCHEMYFLCY